jgi:hypothetical protein
VFGVEVASWVGGASDVSRLALELDVMGYKVVGWQAGMQDGRWRSYGWILRADS